MNPKLRKGIALMLALVLAGSGIMIARQLQQNNASRQSTSAAQALVTSAPQDTDTTPEAVTITEEVVPLASEPVTTDDPVALELANMDLTALQEANSDVKGWIYIPDTNINYPILQGEDNDYYLHHTWEKESNANGSIFIDYRCGSDFTGINTILYGHHMKTGSMFQNLMKYKQQTFAEEHPNIYIVDEDGCNIYTIYAAYEARVDSSTYQIQFTTDEEKQAFINDALSKSVLEFDAQPTMDDKTITLSTCTGNGTYTTRWVVQAYLTYGSGDKAVTLNSHLSDG